MKKLLLYFIVPSVMLLTACGDKSNKKDKKKSSEPETACDCIKLMNIEFDKILDMSMEDIAKNPNFEKEFDNTMEELGDGKCEELLEAASQKYPNEEDYAKECPEFKDFMSKMESFENMGNAPPEGVY